MNSILEKHFELLEKQRTHLQNSIKGLTTERLNRSLNGKWSISQIAGHLITAEQLSLSYITKKINAIDEIRNTGFLVEGKLLFFIISQRLPFKYKAPKTLGEAPKSYPDFYSLQKDWGDSRKELRSFLEKFPGDGLKKKIYRHPVMGRCNIIHALIFFREHIIHHYPQMARQLR